MPKRPATKTPFNAAKRSHVAFMLDLKLDIVKRHEHREGTSVIGRVHGLAPSTVHFIVKNADKIKEMARSATPLTATKVTRFRDAGMESMEQMLSTWIDDQTQRLKTPLSQCMIQQKARLLWKDITKDKPNVPEFSASRGWFDRFRKRISIHNLKMQGESASADHEAAEKFPPFLATIIKEGGYSPKQVVNLDETGLFWKKMPSQTYISKKEKTSPGFKVAKDRLTLLIGGNAEGDLKLKPLLVYRSETPLVLRGVAKGQVPVVWRSNSKVWVTGSVMHDYMFNYVSGRISRYNKENDFDDKALMMIDNAPGHPPAMVDWCKTLKLCFCLPTHDFAATYGPGRHLYIQGALHSAYHGAVD
ncbi:tigger transposable element-derived protein 1-like [Homarus americanus]|uniref:tigger transposable element-derived protein 1-like n=1 Tax=Homarus americanus TaxID=6706 RepID=UPI001C440A6F|nr:tigger transposable element-derived protein 1-like [Homarus americanus]